MKVFKKKPDTNAVIQDEELNADIAVRQQPIPRHVLVLLTVIVLAVVGLVGFRLINNSQDSKDPVVFTIDDKEFRASEVNPYLDAAEQVYGLNRQEAQNGLIEAMKRKLIAERHDIEITDQEIREALKVSSYAEQASNSEPLDIWVEISGYRLAFDAYLEKANYNSKKGYSFVFYFGNLVVPHLSGPNVENYGNEALINNDKEYAMAQAQKYREDLLSGSLTPDEAYEKIKNDVKLNYYYAEGASPSIKFGDTKDKPWEEQVVYDDIVKFFDSYGELNSPSDIRTQRVGIVSNPKSDVDYVDAMYYFVYLTETTDVENLTEELNNIKVIVN